jgi:hypothetical protein
MSHSFPIAFVLLAVIVTAEAGRAHFALSGLYGPHDAVVRHAREGFPLRLKMD